MTRPRPKPPPINLNGVIRLRDLPEEHREPFWKWQLANYGHPIVFVADGVPDVVQDGVYSFAFEDWLAERRANGLWDS